MQRETVTPRDGDAAPGGPQGGAAVHPVHVRCEVRASHGVLCVPV
jgi:hypothetical protein